MIKIWIKKLIKIPLIQVSFMYILRISAVKSIRTSVTTIVKITDRNAGMQNELKLPNYKNKQNECKTIQNFPKVL